MAKEIEIKSSLLNDPDFAKVKASLIAVSLIDGKDKFRVKAIEYINDTSSENGDDYYYDMLEFTRFLNPSDDAVAYTTPDHLIYLNCPNKHVGENLKQWDFTYDHECMHQLWDTFGVAEKIKKEKGSYNHDLLNVASDCVINDYLVFYRKKEIPNGLITPEYLKTKFGVEYDRKNDTQYSLYLKLDKTLSASKKAMEDFMNDPVIKKALEDIGDKKIKPKEVQQTPGGPTPPPQPGGSHSKEYRRGWVDGIKDVVDKKVDPLKYTPKSGNDDYTKGYNDVMNDIKEGMENGIAMSDSASGDNAPNSDLPQIPWETPQSKSNSSKGSSDSSDSSDSKEDINNMSGSQAADSASDSASKAQKSADSAKDKASQSGKAEDKEAADKAQKAADKAKAAADKAKKAAEKGDEDSARDAAKEASEAADEAAEANGEKSSGSGRDSDLEKMSGSEAASDAEKSASSASDAAKKSKEIADGAKEKSEDNSNGLSSKEAGKLADEASKAADKAKKAAEEAEAAAKKGDSEKAKEKAKEARDAAEEAEEKLSRLQRTSKEGDDAEDNAVQDGAEGTNGQNSKQSAGSQNASDNSESKADLEKIKQKAEGIINKYKDKVAGDFGTFIKKCKVSLELKESGLLVKSLNGNTSAWNQKMTAYVNGFVKKKVFQKKREMELTYKRPNRRAGFVKFGEPIQKGKRVKKDGLTINVAFYIDRSGSMSSCISDVWTASYRMCEALKKQFSKEKVVDEVSFKMHAFDYSMHEIKYGGKMSADGGTMDFARILEYINNHTKDYMINIILTDAGFTIDKDQITKFMKDIPGMVLFITNSPAPEVEKLSKKDTNEGQNLFYILADSRFTIK